MLKNNFPVWVPLSFDALSLEEAISCMLHMKRKYDIANFFACGIGLGVRINGMAGLEAYQALGEKIRAAADAVASEGIELGFWCSPTLKSGAAAGFECITDISGTVAGISGCPLDPVWRKLFLERFSAVVKEALPKIIFLEDDFELSNHPGVTYGCFCKHHKEEFLRRRGSAFKATKACYEVQAELTKDTLVDFAKDIRAEVDKINPDIRVGLCQAGCVRKDGNFTEEVVFALAGKKTRPLVRLYGADYGSDTALNIPAILSSLAEFCASLPAEIECWHESDTYPHTGFFTSAKKLHSLLAAAVAHGVEGSLYYATQYLDSPLEDTRYAKLISKERLRLKTFRDTIVGSERIGYKIADVNSPWHEVLGRNALPINQGSDGVELLCVSQLQELNDEEISELLAGKLLMDAACALELYKRGFSSLIGVEVKTGGRAKFWHERIEVALPGPREMYNFIFAPAGSEQGAFVTLIPLSGCQVWSTFVNPSGEVVQAGMTSFVNSLGGRVGIIAYELNKTKSSAIFNYRKQRLFAVLLEYLAEEKTVFRVKNAANVYVIVRKKDNILYACLINLSADTIDCAELEFADKPAKLFQLDVQGNWQESANIKLEYLSPVFIKAENG